MEMSSNGSGTGLHACAPLTKAPTTLAFTWMRPISFRRITRSWPAVVLHVTVVCLLMVFIVVWIFERHTSWANNWFPNFIAEWSGILIAVLVVDRLNQAQRARTEQAVHESVYGSLRYTAGVAIGRALEPMIDFLLALAEVTGMKTKGGYALVDFLEELWEWLGTPRSGIVDPRSCLADFAKTAAEVAARLRGVHTSYFPVLEPPDAIAQIDQLADRLSAAWLQREAGQPIDAEGAGRLIKAMVYRALAPLEPLAAYFEQMVGAPLTTGPWHVPPEEQPSWSSIPESWETVRDESRRQFAWTHWLRPDDSDA